MMWIYWEVVDIFTKADREEKLFTCLVLFILSLASYAILIFVAAILVSLDMIENNTLPLLLNTLLINYLAWLVFGLAIAARVLYVRRARRALKAMLDQKD